MFLKGDHLVKNKNVTKKWRTQALKKSSVFAKSTDGETR